MRGKRHRTCVVSLFVLLVDCSSAFIFETCRDRRADLESTSSSSSPPFPSSLCLLRLRLTQLTKSLAARIGQNEQDRASHRATQEELDRTRREADKLTAKAKIVAGGGGTSKELELQEDRDKLYVRLFHTFLLLLEAIQLECRLMCCSFVRRSSCDRRSCDARPVPSD
jgi:hypothetical protein